MENATKALLIAASVLIVIVLIGISIKMLVPAQQTEEEVGETLKSLAISNFNSRFEKYAGNQSAAEVKSLISMVLTTYREDSKHQVQVQLLPNTGNGFGEGMTCSTTTDISDIFGKLILGYTYEVKISAYTDGYLSLITLK